MANALILPHAIRFNAEVAPEAVAAVGQALGDDDAAAAVERLRAQLGLPGRLRDVGVEADDLDAVARLSQTSAAVKANPRPVSEAEARELLEAAW
jgi:alcohol dehydrogenase class IV